MSWGDRTLDPVQRQLPSRMDIETAKLKVREATRRFLLPFGVRGKEISFKKAVASDSWAEPNILVIQDAQLRSAPEYIFGIDPGECISLQTLFTAVHADFYKDIEFLVSHYQPRLVIVAASNEITKKPARLVQKFIRDIERKCLSVKRGLLYGTLDVEGCIIDEKLKRVIFS